MPPTRSARVIGVEERDALLRQLEQVPSAMSGAEASTLSMFNLNNVSSTMAGATAASIYDHSFLSKQSSPCWLPVVLLEHLLSLLDLLGCDNATQQTQTALRQSLL